MKPLLEKGQANNGKENQDDPFPKYDFFSLIFVFLCVHTATQLRIHLYMLLQ